MMTVPNVHIRDLPPDTLAALKNAARRHGRSLNAELVAALVQRADLEEARTRIAQEVERIRRTWHRRNPDGFPVGLEPETIIRELRDAH